MKIQEAIGQLRCNVEGDYINLDDLEAFEVAVQALEKQIPKKVHFHHSREKGICPNCLSVEDTSANYCRCCGQLLDFDTDHPTEKGGEG